MASATVPIKVQTFTRVYLVLHFLGVGERARRVAMATPEDNPLDDARPRQSTSRLLVLLEKFDGTRNYEEWISHFESITAINKWSDEEKSLWIQVQLTEKAQVALTSKQGYSNVQGDQGSIKGTFRAFQQTRSV